MSRPGQAPTGQAPGDQGTEGTPGDAAGTVPAEGGPAEGALPDGGLPDGAQLTACCVAAYDSDLVALVLGGSYHPGGAALTRRLAGRLGLRPGERVLDVASGPGATALLLAREFGAQVDGVDLGAANLARASAAADAAALADQTRFHEGDAQCLPFDDATFDAVVCECALCTFPDKPVAAAEFGRVLRPGGRVGLTDVTLVPGGRRDELAGLAGYVACLADARPLDDYAALLSRAGLRVTATEHHDDALHAMIDQIEARLRVLRIAARATGHAPPAASPLAALEAVDVTTVVALTGMARAAVASGALGYALLVADKQTA